jgi:hypothetical protein
MGTPGSKTFEVVPNKANSVSASHPIGTSGGRRMDGEEKKMVSVKEQEVGKWIREHERDMILCPNQPGLLLISKKACLKRYRAALGRAFETVSQEDAFHHALKKGLALCQGCPIGQKLLNEERRASGVHDQLGEEQVATGS